MTPEIVLVLSILAAAVLLLVTEWIAMEVTQRPLNGKAHCIVDFSEERHALIRL